MRPSSYDGAMCAARRICAGSMNPNALSSFAGTNASCSQSQSGWVGQGCRLEPSDPEHLHALSLRCEQRMRDVAMEYAKNASIAEWVWRWSRITVVGEHHNVGLVTVDAWTRQTS